jgi:lambda family phage portal protein
MKPSAFDRLLLSVAPGWAYRRARARALALRHYEAAAIGRRTQGWIRSIADVNVAAASSLAPLRALAHDLVRNNEWARNGLRVITRNTVGWGLVPKPVGGWGTSQQYRAAWKAWAETTQCDADGRLTLAGLQKLATRTMAESGEALVRRRWRRAADGLALPMQLQILEPDYIDTAKDGMTGQAGGPIRQGVEFDKLGRRAAYWLFPEHPGSPWATGESRRYPAADILHMLEAERPGQVRGPSWFGSVIVRLRDFDEYEDAVLVAQKIAASFAAFRIGNGEDASFGPVTTETQPSGSKERIESIEPGTVYDLAFGEDVKFSTPPAVQDQGFSLRTLRRIAAGLGVTYEDLTGDFSNVNFSSARMARLAHWANVYDWQWNTLVPQFCDVAWAWAMEAAQVDGLLSDAPPAEWTAQPMPMTEVDREARANTQMIRSGQKTLSQVLREQGIDPDEHLEEYASDMAKLDALKIWLDSDVRRVSAAGLTQERVGGGGDGGAASEGDAAGGEGDGSRSGEGERAGPHPPPVVVNIVPEPNIEGRLATAVRSVARGQRTVKLTRDELGRIVGADVSEGE